MISLSMIARNEETRIKRAIRSVSDCVGEIIVVDTGSTDRTREISTAAGAQVIEFPFNGDFSAARNVSLDACHGEWILVLDADEFFPLSPRLMFEAAVEQTDSYKGFYLLRHNYEENDGIVTYSDHVLRLFRRTPSVLYRYRVHESVEDSLDKTEGRYGRLSAMPLSHYLFERDNSYMISKRDSYIKSLQQDIADDPGNAGRYDFLGCEFVRVGRLEDAKQAFERLLEIDPQNGVGRDSLAMIKEMIDSDTTNGDKQI